MTHVISPFPAFSQEIRNEPKSDDSNLKTLNIWAIVRHGCKGSINLSVTL